MDKGDNKVVHINLIAPFLPHPLYGKIASAVDVGTLVLFGSLADGTETGFSDVDLLWVYPDGLPEREVKRVYVRLSKVMLLYDHLQHHGPFMASETSLRRRSPLPPEALTPPVVLKGARRISIGGWGDGRWALERLVGNVLRLSSDPPDNLYDLKNFLSWIFLLPALSFRVRGVGLTKPQAIRRADEISKNVQALRLATHLREIWRRPRSVLFETAVRASPNPWTLSRRLARVLFKVPKELKGEIKDGFWRDARRFAMDCLRFSQG